MSRELILNKLLFINDDISIGSTTVTANSVESIVIGKTANSDTTGSVVIGNNAKADYYTSSSNGNNVVLGTNAKSTGIGGSFGYNAVVIGYNAYCASYNGIVVGYNASIKGGYTFFSQYNICIGYKAKVGGEECIAIGLKTGLTTGGGSTIRMRGINDIAMGEYAMGGTVNKTGADNIAIGTSSGQLLTTQDATIQIGVDSQAVADNAIAIGSSAITRGEHNIAIGNAAGTNNASATGGFNVMLGYRAFTSPTVATAVENIVIGSNTFRGAVAAAKLYKNVAIGAESCRNNDDTFGSVIIGHSSCKNINSASLSAYWSVAVGYYAGYDAYQLKKTVLMGREAGSHKYLGCSVGIGDQALGGALGTTSSNYTQACTAVGALALSIDCGSFNTAIGYRAGQNIGSGGNYNVAVGSYAGRNITTGDRNIIIGHLNGTDFNTGSRNIVIGTDPTFNSGDTVDNVVIGDNATINVGIDGAVALGNNIVASVTGGFFVVHNSGTGNSAEWSGDQLIENVSSIRFKQNIRTLEDVGEKIDLLRSVRYNPKEGYGDPNEEHIGLLAEELHNVFPEFVNYDIDGETPKGISYPRIVSVLTKEVQSLRQRLSEEENKSENFQDQINKLFEEIVILKSTN